MLLTAGIAGAELNISGYIIYNKGQSIWADQIKGSPGSENWNVPMIHEGHKIKSSIVKKNVAKITIVDPSGCDPEKAIVHLTEGREFLLARPPLTYIFDGKDNRDGHWINFYKHDSISQQLKRNGIGCSSISYWRGDSAKSKCTQSAGR